LQVGVGVEIARVGVGVQVAGPFEEMKQRLLPFGFMLLSEEIHIRYIFLNKCHTVCNMPLINHGSFRDKVKLVYSRLNNPNYSYITHQDILLNKVEFVPLLLLHQSRPLFMYMYTHMRLAMEVEK
jgi:hypothetical protein